MRRMMLVSVRSQGQLEGGHQLATSSPAARGGGDDVGHVARLG
jgi:hypothetical protein